MGSFTSHTTRPPDPASPIYVVVESPGIVEVKQNLEKMLEEGSSNSYREVTIDLTVEHTDESVGILVEDRKYLWLSVVKADGDFTFKLDDAGNPSITGQLGVKMEKHLFTEIYYSNPIGTGEARIIAGWRG